MDKGERLAKAPSNKATALTRFPDGLLVAVAEKAAPLLALPDDERVKLRGERFLEGGCESLGGKWVLNFAVLKFILFSVTDFTDMR